MARKKGPKMSTQTSKAKFKAKSKNVPRCSQAVTQIALFLGALTREEDRMIYIFTGSQHFDGLSHAWSIGPHKIKEIANDDWFIGNFVNNFLGAMFRQNLTT